MPVDPSWGIRPFPSPMMLPPEIVTQLKAPLEGFQMALFFSLLLAVSIIDCRKRIIPDPLCALIAGAGLLTFSPVRLLGPLAALPLLAAAMCKPGSMGGGDIKLTAASGFVLGLEGGLLGMIVALTLAAVFYMVGWMARKLCGQKCAALRQTALPLAPFLSLGFAAIYILNYGGSL